MKKLTNSHALWTVQGLLAALSITGILLMFVVYGCLASVLKKTARPVDSAKLHSTQQ